MTTERFVIFHLFTSSTHPICIEDETQGVTLTSVGQILVYFLEGLMKLTNQMTKFNLGIVPMTFNVDNLVDHFDET